MMDIYPGQVTVFWEFETGDCDDNYVDEVWVRLKDFEDLSNGASADCSAGQVDIIDLDWGSYSITATGRINGVPTHTASGGVRVFPGAKNEARVTLDLL